MFSSVSLKSNKELCIYMDLLNIITIDTMHDVKPTGLWLWNVYVCKVDKNSAVKPDKHWSPIWFWLCKISKCSFSTNKPFVWRNAVSYRSYPFNRRDSFGKLINFKPTLFFRVRSIKRNRDIVFILRPGYYVHIYVRPASWRLQANLYKTLKETDSRG